MPEAHYNNTAASSSQWHVCSKAPHELTLRVTGTALDTNIPPEMPYPLAEWARIISVRRRVTVLTDWVYRHRDTSPLAKVVANNCPLWSQTKFWKASKWRHMPLGNRSYSWRQIDFSGLVLPLVGASRYATTSIGTFTGLCCIPPCHLLNQVGTARPLWSIRHFRFKSRYLFHLPCSQS